MFAQINPHNRYAVMSAIYMDIGIGIGLQLPLTSEKQFDSNKPWTVIKSRESEIGSWGGHYVYVCGYSTTGLQCATWGRKQSMTWEFFEKYCDEVYAIIPNISTEKKKLFIRQKTMTKYLKSISKEK